MLVYAQKSKFQVEIIHSIGFSILHSFAVSGAYIDTVLMELYTHFKKPITFAIRKVSRFTEEVAHHAFEIGIF